MIKRGVVFFLILSVFVLISACNRNHGQIKAREKIAENATGDIVIGVVWPPTLNREKDMQQGTKMAVEEVNKEGGIYGRKIKLLGRRDNAAINEGMLIAHEFADNLNINVVIGHTNSYVSVPVSSIYEFAGVLMLTPFSTSTKLTHQGFKHIFRLFPNSYQIGKYLANYAAKKSYKRVIVFYVRDEYGRNLANHFEHSAKQYHVKIIDRQSFLEAKNVSYYDLFKDWQQLYEFDAILLIGSIPDGAYVIEQMRKAGIEKPIFGADGLNNDILLSIIGPAAEGVIVLSPFNRESKRKEVKAFNQKFFKKYGHFPGYSAALGYDSVKLLCYAMLKTKSTTAAKLSSFLHNKLKDWQGVVGEVSFDKNGDLKTYNSMIVKKVVHDGKFKYLQ